MRRPLLLDLFCGAGGAAKGYHDAGFDIIGVDIAPQKRYPYRFIQADAIELMDALFFGYEYKGVRLRDFQAVHASPPCQGFSVMSMCRPGLQESYPNLIPQSRMFGRLSGLPYVIENVPQAPLRDPVTLCGSMFGKRLRLHRVFESNVPLAPPRPCDHSGYVINPNNYAGRARIRAEYGRDVNLTDLCRREKGVPWMSYHETSEAIMPVYTEHVGASIVAALGLRDAA